MCQEWEVLHCMFAFMCGCMCLPDEEREQVERLRWPSRGYLQELSEYQQRRRKLRKSRCIVMWRPSERQRPAKNRARRQGAKKANGGKQRRLLFCWMMGLTLRDKVEEETAAPDCAVRQRGTRRWHVSLPLEKHCVTSSLAIPHDWSLKLNRNRKWLSGRSPAALWKKYISIHPWKRWDLRRNSDTNWWCWV